jgi:hypothetical protein
MNAEKKARIVTVKNTRILRHTLTDAEKLERGKDMADARAEQSDLEDQLDQVKKEIGARIQQAEARMNSAAAVLRAGYEHRLTPCTENRNYKTGRVIVTRDDTADIVEDRPMSDSERQQTLPLAEAESNND